MKKLLLASVAAAAAFCSSHGLAADVPVKAPVVKAAPTFDWSGLYAGVHMGYGSGHSTWTANIDGQFVEDSGDQLRTNPRGVLGGAQIGYNWQHNQFVLGLEFSGTAGSMKDRTTSPFIFDENTEQTKVRSLWSVTAKLGFPADRNLVYVKGGYSRARVEIDAFNTVGGGISFAADKLRNGWTIGAGWDLALAPNWVFGIEFNYHDFGSAKYSGLASNTVAESFSVRSSVSSLIARLNYKFGS